jgi:hypothetical protein
MALWIKKNSSDWVEAKEIWVKKNASTWVKAKQLWVKKTASTWSQFWPKIGPFPEEDLYLEVSRSTYPASGSDLPELTLFNYHWRPTSPLTLMYKWEVGPSENGPWTGLSGYSNFVTYTPGNPALGNYNTLSFTPDLSDYVSGRVYFNFVMRAIGESTSEYSAMSSSVTVNAPIWQIQPSFTGTPAPNNTIVWNVGKAYISGTSDNVGYMTTIYRTNNDGLTKEYLVGTSTQPEFSFADEDTYSYNLTEADLDYAYYASTYSVFSDSFGEKENATRSATILGNKEVARPPGPFSITSATKGVFNGSTRPISVVWTTSEYATSYEFSIQSSSDQVNWNDWVVYGFPGAFPPETSKTYNIGSNAPYVRVTMRSTNSTGLYANTSTVLATGQAPTAPTIISATSTTTNVILTFEPPSNNGSSNDLAYEKAYKPTSSGTWGNWEATAVSANTITFNDILVSGISYDFKIRVKNFDQLYSPESNIFTISTKTAPGPFTNVFAKTFDSGYITTFFTTGTNTSNVDVEYLFFDTQPVRGDSSNFNVPVLSSSSYHVTNSNFLIYPNDPYNISLVANNEFGLSRDYGVVFFVPPNGSDKPTSSTPTFSNITASGFTANFNITKSTQALIDLRTGGSSVSGYPKLISVSEGSNSYPIPETLPESTQYSFLITPRWTNQLGASFTYTGVQRSANVATRYRFSFGKTLYVSSNGYIGLDAGSIGSTVMGAGRNIAILARDLQQWYLAEYSDTNFYHLYFRSYLYEGVNSANDAVDYQIKFYNNPSIDYCDVYMVRVGANVTLPSIQRGFYGSGNSEYAGTDGASFFIGTGSVFRVYFGGTVMKTTGVPWTTINDNVWDVIQTWPYPNTLDDSFTSVVTAPNQQAVILTPPTISSVTAGNTGGPVSVNFSGGSGPAYQIYWTTASSLSTTAQYTPDGSGFSSPVTDSTGPSSAGTTYYMYIRSVASTGETSVGPSTVASSWSAGFPFIMTTPPVIPTITMASNTGVTTTAGTINWTSTNQASFSSTGTFSATGTTGTSISKTGLTAGTNYTGTVTVTSSTGHTASANYSITTSAAVIPTITMQANSLVTATSGRINWTSTNQQSFSSNGTFSGSGTTATFVAATGLSPSTTYTGTVTVTSSTGNTASANYSFTTSAAPVASVTSMRGSTGGRTGTTTWNNPKATITYNFANTTSSTVRIQRSIDNITWDSGIQESFSGNSATQSTNQPTGTTSTSGNYYYRGQVMALNGVTLGSPITSASFRNTVTPIVNRAIYP